jgi:hypothetical protein
MLPTWSAAAGLDGLGPAHAASSAAANATVASFNAGFIP